MDDRDSGLERDAHRATALSRAADITARFKKPNLDVDAYGLLYLVPVAIVYPDERLRAAEMALEEVRKRSGEPGRSAEGIARDFLARLGEAVAADGAFDPVMVLEPYARDDVWE